MKTIVSKYVDPDTKNDIAKIEVNVNGLSEEQEYLVQRVIEQLMQYILVLKGIISPECSSCCGCGDQEECDKGMEKE